MTAYNDFLDFEKNLLEETQWDLATIEKQPYYVLMELYTPRSDGNLNKTNVKQSMASFIENGGIFTC
ncbi:hypothetical protein [Melissococcus plutonius]|uniref:hypothetical protein n=1 Tax=Melissococcus plutonius TaxID=33970 RepID=UPI0021E572CF|nr:hypothetical protein [Melissococcus plutonius]MCV2520651.1 hypothetical protein [Melissococcus plutonius]